MKQSFCLYFIPKTHFHIFNISFSQHTKTFCLDASTNENNDDHNTKCPYIPDHPYRMLIIRGSGSEKKCIARFNKRQDSDELVDKIYL